jgi:hypothetical protein
VTGSSTIYHGRRAAAIENEYLRVTVLREGGHIAEIQDKETGINPLWTPPWRTSEPSAFGPEVYAEYGSGVESKLLAGIMGHNLCLDIFGGPSDEEAAAGVTVHGEGAIAEYAIEERGDGLMMRAHLPMAQIAFERRIALDGRAVRIRETVENLMALDRPIGWTQHVTLGPPFLEKGVTQFRASATLSKTWEDDFGVDDRLVAGTEFDWPLAPRRDGTGEDLRVLTDAATSCAFTAHLMDPTREDAYFAAYLPAARLVFGYVWKQADFPWMGIWEENYSRKQAPWNGRTLTRGMEFGVSPMPESRRKMVERGKLFGVPAFRWLVARGRVEVEYCAVTAHADSIPETLEMPRG